MFRFVHTADWQLGAANQPLACQFPLEALITSTRKENTNFILCAGDVFHKHSPDQQTKDYLLQTILNNPDIFFAFMAGNHDYTTKEKVYTSLNYLSLLAKAKKITNAWIIEPGRYISSKDVVLWAMNEWDDLGKDLSFDRKNKYVVAIWHGILPGLNLKNGVYDPASKRGSSVAIQKNEINYVALGDIHKQFQVNNKCYYCGALTQTSYVDDLGALLVTLDGHETDVKTMSLDLPKKVSFLIEYIEGEHTEEDIVEFIKEKAKKSNFVKLKFSIPVESFASINKAYVVDRAKEYCLSVIFDNDPVMSPRTRKNIEQMTSATTLEQEIDIVLASEDFGLDKNEIRKRVLEVILHSELE